jgi:outer membrane murein-binding lipoprotein Lpp
MRSLLLVAAVGAAALVAGCGGSNKLSEGDANSLQADKETLADDVQAIAAIDGNKAEAKRLVRSVEKTIVLYERFRKIGESVGGATGGSFSQGAGEAALRLIAKDVPSIVIGGSSQSPTGLDAKATKVYLRYAASDPRRALRGPVTEHVRSMLLDVEDASPDTNVPTLHNQTVEQVLSRTAASLQPYYPDQAAQLRAKANA